MNRSTTAFANMKKGVSTALLVGLGVFSAGAQGQPLFQNFGSLVFPPAVQIDAQRVENLGNITAAGTFLWDTQNTTNFINRGQMSAAPGFRFDYQPWFTANRYPLFGFTNSGQIFASTDLLISATNLNNFNGLLSVTRNGALVLDSPGNMNLFGSRLRAGDGADLFNASEQILYFTGNNPTPVAYDNPLNVVDEYWAGRANAGLIDLPFMSIGGISGTASYATTNRGGLRGSEFLNIGPAIDTNFPSIPGYSFFVVTNLVPHNLGANPRVWRMTVQCVFIQTNLPGCPEVRVYFHNPDNRDNYVVNEVAVEFALAEQDEISGQTMNRFFYFNDRSATNINGGNLGGSAAMMRNNQYMDTFRPPTIDVDRSDFSPFGFFLPGFPSSDTPASVYDPNLFFYFPTLLATNIGARFQTNRVDHSFTAYQFSVAPRNIPFGGRTAADYITGDPVSDQHNDATNSAGRIEITANNLDLGNASLRADNTISIHATNITDMTGARFNAQHVNINLAGTTGALVLSNTFPNTVSRLNGQVSLWSGLWQVDQFITNSVLLGVTNITGTIPLSGSNTVECLYHVIVVDLDNFVLDNQGGSTFFRSSQLQTNQAVDLPRLNVRVPSVELHDTNTVTRELYLGGDCLLIGSNGVFSLTDALQTFSIANAPLLTCFTNLGTFTVPQQANLGFDRFAADGTPQPYSNIINHGTISAGSLLFRTDNFHSTSNLFASGGSVFIDAQTNRLEGGLLFSSLRASLSGGQLLTSNTFFSVGGDLELDFTDRISDQGFTNDWFAGGGVSVLNRPPKGDLLNTRLTLAAPTNLNRTITWAGQDLGDDPNGYNNNVALRELVLDGSPGSLFRFRGPVPGVTNALYIHTLTLTNHTTNYATALAVDSNLKVYFAESPGVPSDKLTNAFPNRFVWVSTNTAAGPMVVVPASLAGRIQMRSTQLEALLASDPDVDGDGIPNELDETPISGFTVNDVRILDLPPRVAVVTWQGVAGWTYSLEYRDGLDAAGWTKLKTVIPSLTGTVTELDTLPPDSQRFYRVRQTRP